MENPSLSRRPDIASKKRYNGGSATSSKATYDDVFGGPPKFGAPALAPRVEDYYEIFGGFHTPRATSIPVLDLPLVADEEDEVFFDVRSSGFDYAEVFGGFAGRDFAVSFEDLVMEQSNGLDDSSDEAWTPEADYLSEESDHSIQDKRFSNGDSCESIDGCTVFNISYNKSGEKLNEDLSIGTRHTTQLHDVSGYTFMVDKVSSLPNSDYPYARDYDDHHNIGYSGEMQSTRHLKKVMSQPANGRNDGLFFGDAVPQMDFVRNGSAFLTISDVSLKTRPSNLPPPSRPPPALNVEKGYSDKTASSCRSVSVSEESGGDSSPPYFDVEVDASSSAVASDAAVKKSMSKAQAKLKKAKESVERNSDAFYSCKLSDSKNGRRDKKEKAAKLVDDSRSIKGVGVELGSLQGGEDRGIEFFDTKEKHKLKKTSQDISDSSEGNYCQNMAKRYSEENEGSKSLSSQGSDCIDVAGEWKEATQFFELVTNKSKKIFDQDSNKTVLEHDSECYERPEMTSGMARAFKRDKSFERSEVENKQKLLDKRVQITKEACRDEPIEKKFGIELQSGETEKRRIRPYDLQKHSASVKVIETAGRQTMKHKDKGSQWKEDDRSMGNAKKFPYGEGDSDGRSGNAFELEEDERKLNMTFGLAENEIRLKKVAPREEKKMEKDINEQEENGKTLNESVERKESERRQKEALEKKENERRLKEIRENEERLKREKEAAEREENEKRQKEIIEREENEERLKQALEKEETQRRQREASELEKAKRVENEMRLKALEKEENESRQAAVDQQKNEKKRDESFATEQCAKQQLEVEMRCKEAGEREEIVQIIKEACESDPGERTEEVCRYLEEVEETETGLKADENAEKVGSISDSKFEWKESKTKHVDTIDRERKTEFKTGEDYIELNQVSGLNNNDIDKTTKITARYDNGSELGAMKEINANETSKLSTDTRNGEEASASGIEPKFNENIKKKAFEAGENFKVAQPSMDIKGSNQRATQQVHASQSTEQKGKKDALPQEDKESERMKRERELELERLRKMEEEREREREREKDRMAVDPTTLETRERAYAEVRQRTLNDARDRLEKACMEAREKSFPDNKASVESRIRAERAAVERATAEARERAFQKAMAESQQSQGAWMSNGSKYQYSSVYNERYGVEGESPQRCKARLERYRRTAERAANALQELNMRDLHAQREQAERNRLAETLDADVKRWSSGKEGNLRALLSTLQYILGPDSGWQPIHLTEVITAAAVKKAYRKATLYVHPDKLQQRGAGIQQKYICEKVFDLLKEAWNRFNSEER